MAINIASMVAESRQKAKDIAELKESFVAHAKALAALKINPIALLQGMSKKGAAAKKKVGAKPPVKKKIVKDEASGRYFMVEAPDEQDENIAGIR